MQSSSPHISPQLACEFQALHSRFDKLEYMIANLLSPAPSSAPILPPRLINKAMSPWCEPYVPMNAKRAIPIITPSLALLKAGEEVLASCSATLTAEEEVKEKPIVTEIIPKSAARSLPTQELDPPIAPVSAAPTSSTKLLCLHCSRPLIGAIRVIKNKNPQKFCSISCKKTFRSAQRNVWGPSTTSTILVDPFIPILERDDQLVEFIEGPAGTGKSKLALEICSQDKALGVAYVTASWIAAFEFAKKLSNDNLIPYIPAASGTLTEIALRARAKEFPDFTNQPKCPEQVAILIASMTHTSHISSHKLPKVVKNKKSGCHHAVREWSTSSTPLGKNLVTLGHSVPLPHTIIVDEAGTVVDSQLQTLTFGVKRVVLLGDRFQRKPIPDKETTEVLLPFQITPINTNSFREVASDRVVTLTQGHRCPRDTYTLISAIYGYNVLGIDTPLKTLPARVSDDVACPTIASTRKGEFTIDELQGQTCEGLIIRTRSQRDLDFLRLHPESVLVALSRHTSRFSWIDSSHPTDRSSERVYSITEFFSRFCKLKIPFDHPDKNLVSVRLIEKSVRPNSRLLSKSPEISTPQPLSDRFANTTGGRKSSARNSNSAREKVPESLSSLREASTASSGGVQSTFSTLKSPSSLPRSTTIVENLLPKHPFKRSDSPEEVALKSADHVTRASTSVNTIPGRNSTGLEVKASTLEHALYIEEKPDMPIGETAESSNKKHVESDRVAHSSATDLSNISDSSDSKFVPPQRCLAPGCKYSGVAFMSNGMCVKHKDFVPPSSSTTDARTKCVSCQQLSFSSPPLHLCDKCVKLREGYNTDTTSGYNKHTGLAVCDFTKLPEKMLSDVIKTFSEKFPTVRSLYPDFTICVTCHLYKQHCDWQTSTCASCDYPTSGEDEEVKIDPVQAIHDNPLKALQDMLLNPMVPRNPQKKPAAKSSKKKKH